MKPSTTKIVSQQPQPITFDLNNDLVSVQSESQGYENPFSESASKLPKDEIVIEVEPAQEHHVIKRKWKIDHDPTVTMNIT